MYKWVINNWHEYLSVQLKRRSVLGYKGSLLACTKEYTQPVSTQEEQDYTDNRPSRSGKFEKRITSGVKKITSADELNKFCEQYLHDFNGIHIAAVFSQLKMIGNKDIEGIVEKLVSIDPMKLTITPTEISQIIWSLGRIKYAGLERSTWKSYATKIIQRADVMMDDFELRDFGMLLHGLANLEYIDEQKIQMIIDRVRDHLFLFSEEGLQQNRLAQILPASISSVVWACGKLKRGNISELLTVIEQLMLRGLVQFGPPELFIIGKTCAQVKLTNQSIMNTVARETIYKLHMFKPNEITQLSVAFAKQGVYNYDLFSTIAQRYLYGQIKHLTISQIADLAWSFSKLRFYQEDFQSKLKQRYVHRLHEFSNNELVSFSQYLVGSNDQRLIQNLLHIYAQRFDSLSIATMLQFWQVLVAMGLGGNVRDDEITERTLIYVKQNLQKFTSTDIWRLSSILLSLKLYEQPLFEQLVSIIKEMGLSKFGLFQLYQIYRNFSISGHFDMHFIQECQQIFTTNISKLQSNQISKICLTMAKWGVSNEGLLRESERRVMEQKIDQSNLVDVVWSYYVLEYFQESLLEEIASKLNQLQVDDLQPRHLSMLYQIHLYCVANQERDYVWDELDNEVVMAAEMQWKQQSIRAKKNQSMAEDVKLELEKSIPSNVSLSVGKQVNDEAFIIDVALEKEQQKIAVLLNTSTCFARNKNNVVIGQHCLNTRILERLGWNVINSRQFDGDLPTDFKEELMQKLTIFIS